jgi:hypothetical protein
MAHQMALTVQLMMEGETFMMTAWLMPTTNGSLIPASSIILGLNVSRKCYSSYRTLLSSWSMQMKMDNLKMPAFLRIFFYSYYLYFAFINLSYFFRCFFSVR